MVLQWLDDLDVLLECCPEDFQVVRTSIAINRVFAHVISMNYGIREYDKIVSELNFIQAQTYKLDFMALLGPFWHNTGPLSTNSWTHSLSTLA